MDRFETWLIERLDHVETRLKYEFRLLDVTVRETLLLVLRAYRRFRADRDG